MGGSGSVINDSITIDEKVKVSFSFSKYAFGKLRKKVKELNKSISAHCEPVSVDEVLDNLVKFHNETVTFWDHKKYKGQKETFTFDCSKEIYEYFCLVLKKWNKDIQARSCGFGETYQEEWLAEVISHFLTGKIVFNFQTRKMDIHEQLKDSFYQRAEVKEKV